MKTEVLILRHVLSPENGFFHGLSSVPQANEDELFRHRAIQAIIRYKWKTSARFQFLCLFAFFFSILVLFIIWTVLDDWQSDESLISYASELRIAVGMGTLALAFVEARQMWSSRKNYFKSSWNIWAWAMIVLVWGSVFQASLLPPGIQNIPDLRPFASLALCVNLWGYLRGFEGFAMYVRAMMNILKDMSWFFVLVGIVLFFFSHAFFLTRRKHIPDDNLGLALKRVYRMGVLGDFALQVEDDEGNMVVDMETQPLDFTLFLLCTFFIMVVFLNVLIAVISDSYAYIRSHSESAMWKGKAELINEMEQIFGHSQQNPAYLIFTSRDVDEDGSDGAEEEWAGQLLETKKITRTIMKEELRKQELETKKITRTIMKEELHKQEQLIKQMLQQHEQLIKEMLNQDLS